MSKNLKVGIVAMIVGLACAGLSYAAANKYDTEAYSDVIKGLIGAGAMYLAGWIKSPE